MHDLVDIGANLTDSAFASDRDRVLDRAMAAGVRRIVLTGTTLETSERARELARSRPSVLWSTAGIHPHHAKECDAESLARLGDLLAFPEVVAAGECGLDFYRDLSPRAIQEEAFEAQVELAAQAAKPLFVHDRQASDRVLPILARHRERYPRAVVHCFTGDRQALQAYLDLGLHVGITGWICDERRGLGLRELVREIPLERLMLETDSPYLLPRNIRPRPRSRRNEPANLVHVLRMVAECRGEDEAAVAAATTRNAIEFFGLTSAPAG